MIIPVTNLLIITDDYKWKLLVKCNARQFYWFSMYDLLNTDRFVFVNIDIKNVHFPFSSYSC